MRNLRSRLPPMNGLVAFEASARLLSFTRAGKELGISREAVSRHIRILETHLGQKLFLRGYRSLELTSAGKELLTAVRKGLDGIAHAAEGLRTGGPAQKVNVTATVAIASFWLTPRLPRFRQVFPEVEIRVHVSDEATEVATIGADVALRYGYGNASWPGMNARRLFEVESIPVCSPAYLETASTIESAADLLDHSLLNLDGASHAQEDWLWWLEGTGVEEPKALNILGFDSYANVIQAALEGQGIALGFSGIVDGLLGQGRLVRPLALSLDKGGAVYLLTAAGSELPPVAQRFSDWVLSEAVRP